MKNFYFLNIGFIIIFSFFLVSSVSIQEQKDKDFLKNLPKINDKFNGFKIINLENKTYRTQYNILYDGNIKPEIKIGRGIYSKNENDFFIQFKHENKKGLTLFVDTNQIITKRAFNGYESFNTKAYPVFLFNNSNNDQKIGFGEVIYMVMEAKNLKGEWQPIEKQYSYFCGTGIYGYTLIKGNLCVTTAHKYSGSFKTKLRLRHLGNYSNEFEGSINPNEFIK